MKRKFILSTIIIFFILVPSVHAQLRLAKIFADSMIIQREQPVKIWGWATPNETVAVLFNGKLISVKSNTDSSFSMVLPKQKAGGPYTFSVSSANKNIGIKDVYFGDVWFCSGQSNMEFRLSAAANGKTEIPMADFPLIRQFEIYKDGADSVLKDIKRGGWKVCNSNNAGNFSAVAYFFAKEIYQQTKVPIAIIYSTWGGSDIVGWMDKEQVKEFSNTQDPTVSIKPGFMAIEKKRRQEMNNEYENNYFSYNKLLAADKNIIKNDFFNEEGWQPIKIPGTIQSQNLPFKKGYMWMKNEFEIGESNLQEDLTIEMDRIRESEVTFINGIKIGHTIFGGYMHNYKVPKNLLRSGKNEIIICCYSETNNVGFSGIYLPKIINKKKETVFLFDKGWQYKQGVEATMTAMLGKLEPLDFERKYPTLIYNAMVAPLSNYGIKGFLWYQGEQNASPALCWQYGKMLTNLITSWRLLYKQMNAPFYIVQLPNYGKATEAPTPHAWAVLREQQAKVANDLPSTGFVTTIDVGNPDDIHPTNKIDVGKRLSLLALKNVYGKKNITAESPSFKLLKIENNKAVISFNNMGGGLIINDKSETATAFVVAGADNIFYRATAIITGDKVTVYSDKVPNPIAVRYAFEATPPPVNLFSKEGLPVTPFRTDTGIIKKL
jgi:sialate O-acetylesterase